MRLSIDEILCPKIRPVAAMFVREPVNWISIEEKRQMICPVASEFDWSNRPSFDRKSLIQLYHIRIILASPIVKSLTTILWKCDSSEKQHSSKYRPSFHCHKIHKMSLLIDPFGISMGIYRNQFWLQTVLFLFNLSLNLLVRVFAANMCVVSADGADPHNPRKSNGFT